jgi:type II secretory pathway pseudopilin PulG
MRRAGYSLFEVLIAFAVMTMVLAVILPRQAGLLARASSIETRLAAQDAALSHLAGLRPEDLSQAETVLPQTDWHIRQIITPTHLDEVTRDLLAITIRVETPKGRVLAEITDLRVAP